MLHWKNDEFGKEWRCRLATSRASALASTQLCSHSRCYETGPASGSATCIESSRVPWERIPWEQAEVLFEDSGEFLFVHIRLVKPRPFLSK